MATIIGAQEKIEPSDTSMEEGESEVDKFPEEGYSTRRNTKFGEKRKREKRRICKPVGKEKGQGKQTENENTEEHGKILRVIEKFFQRQVVNEEEKRKKKKKSKVVREERG